MRNVSNQGVETKTEICPKHGEYLVQCVAGLGIAQHGCPECAKERAETKAIAEEREREQQRQYTIALAKGSLEKDIPPRFRRASFDSYVPGCERSREKLKRCMSYAIKFKEMRELGTSLMLLGRPGTGKTHMAISILKQIADEGYRSRYVTLTQILREIRSTWSDENSESESYVLKNLMKLDLLVIDEIGVQSGTDNERKILFEIIDSRYLQMAPTILLSNLEQTQVIDLVGERVVDRMYENKGGVLTFNWPSHRAQRGNAA